MRILIVLFALTSLSCSGGGKAETPTPPPTTERPKGAVDDSKMLKHWIVATDLRDAVVRGNLEQALGAAGRLSDDGPALPGQDWLPHVVQLREHIRAAKSAESLEEASVATAKLGATCGSCHSTLGADLQMPAARSPLRGASPRNHMKRHMWAVNAMWEGLVGPSDGRWSDGVGLLAEQPLHDTEKASEYVSAESVKEIGERLHDLGVRGTGVTDPSERAVVFGDIIATCGECHGQTHTGPAKPQTP